MADAAPAEETTGESGNGNTGLPAVSTPQADVPAQEDTQPDRPYFVNLPGRAPFTLTLEKMEELLQEVFAEFDAQIPV